MFIIIFTLELQIQQNVKFDQLTSVDPAKNKIITGIQIMCPLLWIFYNKSDCLSKRK